MVRVMVALRRLPLLLRAGLCTLMGRSGRTASVHREVIVRVRIK